MMTLSEGMKVKREGRGEEEGRDSKVREKGYLVRGRTKEVKEEV